MSRHNVFLFITQQTEYVIKHLDKADKELVSYYFQMCL